MGIYLNPKNPGFSEAVNSEIYVDKSGIIAYTNKVLKTEQKNICISRPRRFGKSMAAKMLAAYYSKGCEAKSLFENLSIAQAPSYATHLNSHNVIFLNMQSFLSETHDASKMIARVQYALITELAQEYPELPANPTLPEFLENIYHTTEQPFIFIIDEWDCIFREKKETEEGYRIYLDFLRNLLKDRSYVGLTYMTGILPIKKYGSHSALNMFTEFSMTNPRALAEYVGFTENEVQKLCEQYNMDFAETSRWYDGYTFKRISHIYSPKSVVDAMLNEEFDSYWTQTETYEALKVYIDMNFDGLKDSIVEMISGNAVKLNIATFGNDMTSFNSKDDVMTLLIHLGYLAYDSESQKAFIPNHEVAKEFENSLLGKKWNSVATAIKESENLLEAVWNKNEDYVANALEQAHLETSILTYNNENSLTCVISLAFYCARNYYMAIRELPTGKGFADIVFLPRPNHLEKPAIIIELKWDKTVNGAITQIKNNCYGEALKDYSGKLLLVGINYDKKTKKHECLIEEVTKK